MTKKLTLDPIGHVEYGEEDFSIVLKNDCKKALLGLSDFSHVQVLWWFDRCDNDRCRNNLTVRKPYTNGPDVLGTFATRSPERPNPIAVTTCDILWIDEVAGVLHVPYIDAEDRTPVLDLKPYTPSVDRVENPKTPDWCAHWPKSYEESGDFDWESEFSFPQ